MSNKRNPGIEKKIGTVGFSAASRIGESKVHSNQTNPETVAKDKKILQMEADVLVIGGGIGGYTAAIEAVSAGAKVIILEKMKSVLEAPAGATGAKGNDTAKSGGGWGALFPYPFPKDTPIDQVIKTGMVQSKGMAFPELCKVFWSRLNEDFFWFKETLKLPLKDRSTELRPHSYSTIGKGPRTARLGMSYASKIGVKILYNHKAFNLLCNRKGEIIGVKTMTPSGIKDIMAKTVILATGGFQGNHEMKLKYLGRELAVGALLSGSTWNTGDGHQMAMEIGAKMVNMDSVHTRWCTHKRGLNPHRNIGVYGIYINQNGKRFVDEAGSSNETSLATVYQPESICALLIDSKIKDLKIVSDAIKAGKFEKSELIRADTLDEVAERIGVKAAVLKKNVEDFNSNVNQKEHKALNADPPKGKDRATVYKIESPPFYFFYPMHPALNHTTGGPLINEKCEILNNEDKVIPGLYGVGALAFGFMDGLYHITEMVSGLELSLTLGRVAGVNSSSYALSRRS